MNPLLPPALVSLLDEQQLDVDTVVTVDGDTIVGLDLTDAAISVDSLDWLRELPDLEVLRLPHVDDADEPLVLPSECTRSLRELVAHAPAGIALAPLAGSTSLEVLDLSNSLLEAVDLAPLAGCQALRRLLLGGNLLGEIDLAPLASCRSLQQLDLSRMSDVDPQEEYD
jgi:hypothetical protein